METPEQWAALDETWERALCIVAHPDDMEFGAAAAVARWTGQGKWVGYTMVTSGEAGIDGMHPDECRKVREAEQVESARIVGVDNVGAQVSGSIHQPVTGVAPLHMHSEDAAVHLSTGAGAVAPGVGRLGPLALGLDLHQLEGAGVRPDEPRLEGRENLRRRRFHRGVEYQQLVLSRRRGVFLRFPIGR